MSNQFILQRLQGIQGQLVALHGGSSDMSSTTKGAEREDFVSKFLAEVMPLPYRFGSGDITDQKGKKTGQVDIVVEYPFLPSLPMIGGSDRLYIAEGVAAVVEVKSNIAAQWEEIQRTASAVKQLERQFGTTFSMGPKPQSHIPLFTVGYTGWSHIGTLKSKLKDVDGILVIDKGLFISNETYQSITALNAWALWGLIQCLHIAASALKSISANPLDYAR